MSVNIEKIDEYRYKLPRRGKMKTDGLIYASHNLMKSIAQDQAIVQVANVAQLPGLVGYSLAMPDIHWGYGFCIGGVAAMDIDQGVVSPGGVGYDINCGVRLLAASLDYQEIKEQIPDLLHRCYQNIPVGVGRKGNIRLSAPELKKLLLKGAGWAIGQGYGEPEDLLNTESAGVLPDADPGRLSARALERGQVQVGTLGSGNHFIEIGYVDEVFDARAAAAFGLRPGQVTVLLHSGSRGLGYQVCDDALHLFSGPQNRLMPELPDRQLACAPIGSKLGQGYLSQMAAAANYAWVNRQVMTHQIRLAFQTALSAGPARLNLRLVYDVCHNIAKAETHLVDGQKRRLVVHRKGATRAFGPGHQEVPEAYRAVGQPVLVPGDMGRCSYVLAGTQTAMDETFGSTCHGAGRMLSRKAAKKCGKGRDIARELAERGILVLAGSRGQLAEEMSEAYKDVTEVVEVCCGAGLAAKVARLRPLGVIKG